MPPRTSTIQQPYFTSWIIKAILGALFIALAVVVVVDRGKQDIIVDHAIDIAHLFVPEAPRAAVRRSSLEDVNKTLRNLGRIPEVVYFTWKTSKLDESDPFIKNGLGRFQALNPSWKIVVSNDSNLLEDLRNWVSPEEFNILREKHPVQLADSWRLGTMCHKGGLYMDLDRLCNKRISVSNLTKMILLIFRGRDGRHFDFSQDAMGSAPKNPVFCTAFTDNINRYVMCDKDSSLDCQTYRMGPMLFMESVSRVLFGGAIQHNVRGSIRKTIFHELEALYPFVLTKEEHPPLDTFFFQDDGSISPGAHESLKQEYYARNQIAHWSIV
eukprot:m.172704 g.172704  ORF g.172704 m.172704 type:complete len:326 (-) comp18291_c0_seq2:97-1074(-)